MRRALVRRLPLLARVYGLLPHHLDDMPLREISEFLTDLDQVIEDHNK